MNAVLLDKKIHDTDVTYTPFVTPEGRIGYIVVWADGRTSYLYLNPSTETDDGQPNVFVYEGPSPNLEHGAAVCFVNVNRALAW
jgi:hypothetical protein